MTWKRDTRPENVRTIGDFTIYSEVDKDEGTAHVVRFPDGSELRVLPDERSGRKRSYLVREAVEDLNIVLKTNTSISPQTYLYGLLLEAGFTKWEWEVGEVSVDEWLAEWFELNAYGAEDLNDHLVKGLLADLDADGWTITRKGET